MREELSMALFQRVGSSPASPFLHRAARWRDNGLLRFSILRRADKRQKNFAFNKVESVANTTAFVGPAAFVLDGLTYARIPSHFIGRRGFRAVTR
jgi:hypothetical protein